jgi:XTP/dITP diphosphohydrolase
MKIIFATHNQNKVKELNQLVPEPYKILSLNDINCLQEIEESGKALEDNAKIKADYVRYKYGLDCFSDDSGLEVDALNGAPGVYSARYAGEEKNNDANIQKIWNSLKEVTNTAACFRSVFYVHLRGKTYSFEGRVAGNLIFEKRGLGGFGYDPIFIPSGYKQTFAELGDETKNKISHRANATKQLIKLLNTI